MAKPDDLATYAILQSYVTMIATKCSKTYSKKTDTIKKIECSNAIPTDSSSTTEVMCLICTYDDGSTINIDATPITAAMSDVVSKSDLTNALKDYTKTVDLNTLFSKYTTTDDLTKDFLKKVDAYLPSNKNTLNLFSQDTSGNLLFNGKAISSSSDSSVTEWTNVSNKPFDTISSTSFCVVDGELRATGNIVLDDTLSETSENGVKNKAIASEFKNYTTTLTSKLSEYTKTTTLQSDYALKTELHKHTNKSVLDNLSDDAGKIKYGTNVLLTEAVIEGLISEKNADKKYVALSNIETNTLDLTTL